MIQLRDYQQDLVDGVQAALGDEQARVMMQLPTGGGKTVIAGALLNAWLKGGRKAVWLTHRRELVTQTRDLLASSNVAATVNARWKPGEDAPARRNRVAILMAQTVSRRTAGRIVWAKYSSNDLMIIDEAHHAAADGWTRAMRQWPGRILGMTATPWRLSQKEGFDHLFNALLCGPPVVDLQSGNHLCDAQVRRPSSQWIIRGGAVGMDGDFTDAGIKAANRANIMTAGALKFWQEHAQDRQTIVYAVSVDHAHNLAAVFRNAGVPAAAMLGETKDEERAALMAAFKRGILRVLVNVAVATEGFDLPDASCVVITRPTKSLTLYLQMVGRGLRPKEENGNCLILDMAANAEVHGLPEDDREWSLEPRAAQEDVGDAVTVWCDNCNAVSPAASHACQTCGEPFGKECSRCGKWRAWNRWRLEKQCGDAHEFVCDLCHRDAHIEARLPVTEDLEELAALRNEEIEMTTASDITRMMEMMQKQISMQQKQLEQLEEQLAAAHETETQAHETEFHLETYTSKTGRSYGRLKYGRRFVAEAVAEVFTPEVVEALQKAYLENVIADTSSTLESSHSRRRRPQRRASAARRAPAATGNTTGSIQPRERSKTRALTLSEQGTSQNRIAQILNEEGYRTQRGKLFDQRSVWHLIHRSK